MHSQGMWKWGQQSGARPSILFQPWWGSSQSQPPCLVQGHSMIQDLKIMRPQLCLSYFKVCGCSVISSTLTVMMSETSWFGWSKIKIPIMSYSIWSMSHTVMGSLVIFLFKVVYCFMRPQLPRVHLLSSVGAAKVMYDIITEIILSFTTYLYKSALMHFSKTAE